MFRKKFYTLLAAVALIASAALTANANTIYVYSTGSSAPYLYAFGETEVAIHQLTNTETINGMTFYTYDNTYSNTSFIFASASDWSNQTGDLKDVSTSSNHYYFYDASGTKNSAAAIELSSISSSTASDWYYMSNTYGWGSSSSVRLYSTGFDKVYTATLSSGALSEEMQISNTSYYGWRPTISSANTWVSTSYNYASGSNGTCSIGSSSSTTVTMVTEGTDNTAWIIIGDDIVSSDSSTDSGDGDDDTTTSSTIWLSGVFNSWPSTSSSVDDKYVFTQSEDDENTWTLTVSNFSSYFKILIDGTWYGTADSAEGEYYGYLTTQMASGITLSTPGTNIIMLLTDGSNDETYVWESVTFTLKYSNGTYTLYAEADSSWHEGGSSGYYLMCDDNSWTASSSYQFTKSATENVYTLTLSTFTADSNGFKVASSDWSSVNLTSSSSLTVGSSESDATSISLSTDSGDNHIYYSTSAITYASITFVLTYSNSSWSLYAYATTSYTLSTSGYDYYIVGDWNEIDGLWLPNPLGKLSVSTSNSTQVYYTAIISDFYGYFKVLAVPSGRYDIENGIWLTCADSYKVALGTSTEIASNYSNDATENNMAVVSSTTEYSSLTFQLVVYTGDDKSTSAFLTVTETSSDSTDTDTETDTNYYLVTSFNDYSYNVASTKTESTDETSTSTTSITYTVTFSSADVYSNFIAGYGNNTSLGVYAYAWYYTEDGTEVNPLGTWPGTSLEFTAYNDVKSFTLPTTTSLNLVVNNAMSYEGVAGGTYDGAQQTKDIVPGAYYGTYDITITDASKTETYCGNSYYADYTTNVEPSDEINIYVVPDETLGNNATTAPTLHIFNTSEECLTGSWNSSTATMTIDESTGKYLWKYTVSSPNTVLGLVMHNESDQTVDITGIAADVYLNYVAGDGATGISADNYKTLALNIDVSGDDSSSSSEVDNDGWMFKTIHLYDGTDNTRKHEEYYFKAVIVQLNGKNNSLDDISNIECTDTDGLTMLQGYQDDFGDLASSEYFYVQQGNTGNRYGYYSGTVSYGNTAKASSWSEDDGWFDYRKGTYRTQLESDWTDYKEGDYDYMLFLIGTDYSSDANIITTESGGRYVAVILATETQIASGIEEVDSEGNVIVAETYYTIQGLQVQNPEDWQFYIVVRKYADGSVKAFKEAIR